MFVEEYNRVLGGARKGEGSGSAGGGVRAGGCVDFVKIFQDKAVRPHLLVTDVTDSGLHSTSRSRKTKVLALARWRWSNRIGRWM